jgi:DNA-binding LytR/AlgR family response regulator
MGVSNHLIVSLKEPELIKVLVVEADSILSQGLSAGLQQYGYTIAGIAGQAEEAVRLFKENDADIILINTHVPGDKDGIDTVLELMKIKRVPVIYLIAFADATTIARIKQTYPVAFLIKPYDSSNISIAIEMAMHNFMTCGRQDIVTEANLPVLAVAGTNGHDIVDKEVILRQGNYIFIKRNFLFVKIKLSEILYLEADGNYVHVVIKDKKFTVRLSLMQVIQKINYSRFARINRSSVVNVDAIKSFNKEQVEIAQYEIPIGKSYKESFFRQLLPPVIQRYDNGQSWL